MSNTATKPRQQQSAPAAAPTQPSRAVATITPPRLPYHPAVEERFGVGLTEWRALVDAIFPLAKETSSIILALSYCKARKLDIFKRPVHIVPMWSTAAGRMIETVWPGVGELRTTAFRTGQYAGRDKAEFGPMLTQKVGSVTLTFPEWCQITVHRVLDGQRIAFHGPRVYWLETYATAKKDDPSPNSMWRKRIIGQLEKCAEAAALRGAFPEEVGNDLAAEEMEGKIIDGELAGETPRIVRTETSKKITDDLDALVGEEGEVIDGETGEIIRSSGQVDDGRGADEAAGGGGELEGDGAVSTDLREAALAECRSRVMAGEKAHAVLNALGDRRQLLNDADAKALRDAEKAVAANGKSTTETATA